jgi:Uma2 family endonuclease
MATVSLRIGPFDRGRKLSIEEFEEAEEEPGYRYELAGGALEVTQIPGEPHGLIVWALMNRISLYHAANPGVIFLAGGSNEFRLRLAEVGSARHPDVAVALRKDRPDPPARCRPALVMEVVSAGAEAHERDYVTKRQEYLDYGIGEYWIVDRFERKVSVLTRDGSRWAEHVFGDHEEARGSVLVGFAVVVDELWRAAEQAPDEDNQYELGGRSR